MNNQYFLRQDGLEIINCLIIFGINELIFLDIRFGIDLDSIWAPFWLRLGSFWHPKIDIKSVSEIKLR